MGNDRRVVALICILGTIDVVVIGWTWRSSRSVAEEALAIVVVLGLATFIYLRAHLSALNRVRQDTLAEMERLLARRERSLQQRVKELSILHRISLAASASIGVDQVLQNATEVMRQTLPYPHLAAFLIDEPSGRLVIRSGYGEGLDDAVHLNLHVGEGITGRVAQTGEPAMLQDVSSEKDHVPAIPSTRSEVCVPMKIGDRVIGGINVESPQADAFDEGDLSFLTTIASQLAISLDNARLFDELRRTDADQRRRVEELTTLRQISNRLLSSLDLSTVLQGIAESALHLVKATDVHLYLYDEETQTFTSGTSLWTTGESQNLFVPRATGITMTAVRERRPIVIQDATSHPLYTRDDAQGWNVKAIASFPLMNHDAVVGAFNVAFVEPHTFTEDELRVLTMMADQAAIAVDNARLHQALAEQAKRDSLTQVYNHRYLVQRLASAVQEAERSGQPLSFIMLDVDHFKEYNDRYGHVAGDEILTAIVQAISSNVKHTDTVARWGGEEFGVLLPDATAQQAQMIAERIRVTIASLRLVDGKGQTISNPTVSQGIANLPEHARSAEELVDRADRALYRAKEHGRDQIVIADHTSVLQSLTIGKMNTEEAAREKK